MGEARVTPEPDLVSGRYRLLEVLGTGGMGRVWLADDELLDRRVAIKEVSTPTDVTATQLLDLQTRVMREARAAARLDHPAVVTVYDVVWRPGQSWIVMEYVNSRSLNDAVRADGPMSHPEAARIGLQVLGALRAAHAVGVLHRDVKPHNVLLAADGRVVLTDFGLATFEGADHSSDPLMGSPHFVAPERLRANGGSGEAADLWSLGATLYAAVEGRAPFARPTTDESLSALLNDPPDPALHPGLLTPILQALLVKDPAQRLSAEQAESRLRRAAARRAVGVVPRRGGSAPVPPPPPAMSAPAVPPSKWSSLTPVRRPRPSRRTVAMLAGAAALLAGAIGTAVVVNTGPAGRPPVVVSAAPGSAAAPPPSSSASPSAAPAARAAAVNLCGFTAPASGPVGMGQASSGPLPAGFVWHRDTMGFALALPSGWVRSRSPGVACFSDPAAARALTVTGRTSVTGQPLRYWRSAEKAAIADGSLPGYHQVGMGTLDLRDGGADWEYTWQPADGPRLHTRRVLLALGGDREFSLQWTCPDQDWSVNASVEQAIVSSLQKF